MILYEARNIINNKVYYGITAHSLDYRKRDHIYKAFKLNSKLKFHRAIKKFGESCFIWSIIIDDFENEEDMMNCESFWIFKNKSYDSRYGYNTATGGVYTKHTEEMKLKNSKRMKEWWDKNEDQKDIYSRWMKERMKDTTIRNNLSIKVKERMKDPDISVKQKENLRAYWNKPDSKRIVSEETKQKISKKNSGSKRTEESKKLMSIKNRESWTEEKRKKMSKYRSDKWKDPTYRQYIIQRQKEGRAKKNEESRNSK